MEGEEVWLEKEEHWIPKTDGPTPLSFAKVFKQIRYFFFIFFTNFDALASNKAGLPAIPFHHLSSIFIFPLPPYHLHY